MSNDDYSERDKRRAKIISNIHDDHNPDEYLIPSDNLSEDEKAWCRKLFELAKSKGKTNNIINAYGFEVTRDISKSAVRISQVIDKNLGLYILPFVQQTSFKHNYDTAAYKFTMPDIRGVSINFAFPSKYYKSFKPRKYKYVFHDHKSIHQYSPIIEIEFTEK